VEVAAVVEAIAEAEGGCCQIGGGDAQLPEVDASVVPGMVGVGNFRGTQIKIRKRIDTILAFTRRVLNIVTAGKCVSIA